MKRFTVIMVAMAALAMVANLAIAGDYHVGRLLVCSDCHIMHGSQQHGYQPGTTASDDTTYVQTQAYPYLLRGETVTNACLNCHDGNGATIPDVLGATSTPPTGGRSAGALNVPNAGAHGYTNSGDYTQGTGHTLWSEDPPPGWDGVATVPPQVSAEGLQCSDCHRVHGNKYFRNMNGITSVVTYMSPGWLNKEVPYVIGAANIPSPNTGATAVWVLEKNAHGYDNDNVQYLEPDGQESAYGKWCETCHTKFHGNFSDTDIHQAGLNGEPIRHPTAGVEVTAPTTGAWSWKNAAGHRVKLMDNTATWDGTNTATMTPSCFSCHKSHGNANKFGLIFVLPNTTSSSAPAGSDPRLIDPTRLANMTEQGDGGEYRDLCRNCHGMGSWPKVTAGITNQPTNILP